MNVLKQNCYPIGKKFKRMVRLKYPIILISKLDSGLRVCPDNIFSYTNIF